MTEIITGVDCDAIIGGLEMPLKAKDNDIVGTPTTSYTCATHDCGTCDHTISGCGC